MIESASKRLPKYSRWAIGSRNTVSASPDTSTRPAQMTLLPFKGIGGGQAIAAIGNGERFPFPVVREQNRDASVPQLVNDVLDAVDGDRIDPREWLVQQYQHGVAGQAAGNFQSTTFPPGQRARNLFLLIAQPELPKQFVYPAFAVA